MTPTERQARRLASVLRPGAEFGVLRASDGWRVTLQTTRDGACVAHTTYPPRPTPEAAWEPVAADLLDDASRLLRQLGDAMGDAR